jgi:microcystin degradation protein MlrC
VLVDVADNPLSGGGADTTALLREVLAARIPRTLVGALCDPAVLQQAAEAGEGAAISCALGGKVSPEFGDPIAVRAQVVRLSDGRFRNTGPMNKGLEVDTGGAAHLRIDDVDVVLTGQPITANDPELFGHLGIDVGSYDLVVLKAKNHFRAAYEPVVGDIVYVDAPGVASNDLTRFPFRNVSGQLWPFDSAATFDGDLTTVVIPAGGVAR